MNLIQLIEKNDRIQISILQYLLDNGPELASQDIMDALSISRFVFKNNIEGLREQLQNHNIPLSIQLHPEKDLIRFEKSDHADLRPLYYAYLQRSADYQLLVYLFKHSRFSILGLADTLALSEAAVYRKIGRLNQSLAEFNITIKKRQLAGEPLQIAYFFFQLFWRGIPAEQLDLQLVDRESYAFLNLLETRLDYRFSESNRIKLFLWIKVLKQRQPFAEDRPVFVEQWQESAKTDPLYHIVGQTAKDCLPSLIASNHQKLTQFLYLFLTSMSVFSPGDLPASPESYWPTFDPKVRLLNDLVVDQVKTAYRIELAGIDSNFMRSWKYYLTQIHSSLCHFSGIMTFFEEEFLFSYFINNTIASPNLELAEAITTQIELFLETPLPPASRLFIVRNHLYFINQMEKFSERTLKIGVVYGVDPLQENIVTERIRNVFSGKFQLICENAKRETFYDLLITDSMLFATDYDYKRLYLANELRTTTDLAALNRLLTELTNFT